MLVIKQMVWHSPLLISRDYQHKSYERDIHKHYEYHGAEHLQSEYHNWVSFTITP